MPFSTRDERSGRQEGDIDISPPIASDGIATTPPLSAQHFHMMLLSHRVAFACAAKISAAGIFVMALMSYNFTFRYIYYYYDIKAARLRYSSRRINVEITYMSSWHCFQAVFLFCSIFSAHAPYMTLLSASELFAIDAQRAQHLGLLTPIRQRHARLSAPPRRHPSASPSTAIDLPYHVRPRRMTMIG